MIFYVYGLIDPRNNELKYIGFTNNIKERLNSHCRESRLKTNSHKNNWIKNLKNIGMKPQIYPIENYNIEEEALQAEIDLISYYKYIGCNLTNVTKGGDKGAVYERTDEVKQKISKSVTGRKHLEETKIKISKTLTGIKRNHSKEHREKISATLTGRKCKRPSEETIEKLRIANIGKKINEEIKNKAVNNNKSYKLNKNDILNIKELYNTGNYTQFELGKLYNVRASHISRIINNKSGKYLQ